MPGAPLRQSSLPFDLGGESTLMPAAPGVALPVAPVALTAPAAPVAPTAPDAPATHTWTVEYVRHPRARRYLLRVRVDGRVRATIPRGGSKREAARFVEAHREWIVKQLAVAARLRTTRRPSMPVSEQQALIARARRELPPRLLELAARFSLTVRRISIRNQKWRWGSCSRQAHICLNWRLVTMPDWVRDYVLIHELMHLRRMDHSPAFWKHVAAACPDYQQARAWLREHSRQHAED